MQDLRLIGVHEDGAHLILGDAEGNRYRVALDESLRAAARRDRPRLGQLQIEIDGALRPKDVQAMIRAGLTAEETAERAGWTLEKVHRYEVPILAEREHVAGLARQVRLRGRAGGPKAVTLDDRVEQRLHSRQIDSSSARWDSRRDDASRWMLTLYFNAGGRQRQAEWAFDPLARTVQPVDDEARWLSEDDDATPAGPIPAPHLSGRGAGSVYDVEAEGGLAAPERAQHEQETIELTAAMRDRISQRGRRRRPKAVDAPGLHEVPPEAAPLVPLAMSLDDAGTPPAAHPHPRDEDPGTPPPRGTGRPPRKRPRANRPTGPEGRVGVDPVVAEPTRADDAGQDQTDPAEADQAGLDAGGPTELDVAETEPAETEPADVPPPPPVRRSSPNRGAPTPRRPAQRKSGRPSVPSWDDIMFGKKSD